jgi:hypothetical protein
MRCALTQFTPVGDSRHNKVMKRGAGRDGVGHPVAFVPGHYEDVHTQSGEAVGQWREVERVSA